MTEEHGVSVKRACQAARLSRAAYYRPETDRGARDREVIEALNEIVSKELRWGFWKCFDRLRQMGKPWNHKRVHRVYCQMRLNQKRRTKRRLPTRPRQLLMATQMINAVWALDFMHDTLYSGRTFRTLNVIDEADRGCLGIDLSTSIPAARVIRFVEQLIEIHGKPAAIRCDNVLNAIGEPRHGDSIRYRGAGAARPRQRASSATSRLPRQQEAPTDHSGNKIRRGKARAVLNVLHTV